MKTERKYVFAVPQLICYDDDGGDEGGEESSVSNEATFTQDQVNAFLAEDRRKQQEKFKKQSESFVKMEKQLEAMIARESTTAQERASLEADLEELRATQRTSEQQKEHEIKQAREKHLRELQEAQTAATTWETMFKKSTIERSLMDAAAEHNAYNANDFIAILGPRSEMREVKDSDGNPTGKLAPMVSMEVLDEATGQMLQVWKTPSEAIKAMKDQPEQHGNKFRDSVIAGIGGGTATSSGGSSTGKINPNKLPMDEFAKRFKEDPGSLGLPVRRR